LSALDVSVDQTKVKVGRDQGDQIGLDDFFTSYSFEKITEVALIFVVLFSSVRYCIDNTKKLGRTKFWAIFPPTNLVSLVVITGTRSQSYDF
jgi:hypothetical protein